jgi:archaellum component FlaG (FlaF/FlaG flagellin family)
MITGKVSRLSFCSLILLPILLTGETTASIQTGRSNTADLEVVKWQWRNIDLSSKTDVTLVVKNTGGKIITAVNYSVYYIDSIRDDRIVDKLTLRTDDKPIKPGQTRKFRKVFDCCHHSSNIGARLVITRVEFNNGTYWEIEKSKNR